MCYVTLYVQVNQMYWQGRGSKRARGGGKGCDVSRG